MNTSDPTLSIFSVALLLAVPALADSTTTACVSSARMSPGLPAVSLSFAGCTAIMRPGGLDPTELSGLGWAPGSDWMWTVSDNQSNLYRVAADGTIGPDDQGNRIALGTNGQDLEGIVYTGGYVYAVEESSFTIVTVKTSDFADPTISTSDIRAIACGNDHGADPALCSYMRSAAGNGDGFEGITYGNGRFYLLIEKNPGVLVEVDGAQREILDYTLLNCGGYRGGACSAGGCASDSLDCPFPDSVAGNTQDFSGISFDNPTGLLWIASDKAGAIFLYDPASGEHNTYPLAVTQALCPSVPQTSNQCIQQAEGVTYVDNRGVLDVVNDRHDVSDSIYYEFTIRRP